MAFSCGLIKGAAIIASLIAAILVALSALLFLRPRPSREFIRDADLTSAISCFYVTAKWWSVARSGATTLLSR